MLEYFLSNYYFFLDFQKSLVNLGGSRMLFKNKMHVITFKIMFHICYTINISKNINNIDQNNSNFYLWKLVCDFREITIFRELLLERNHHKILK